MKASKIFDRIDEMLFPRLPADVRHKYEGSFQNYSEKKELIDYLFVLMDSVDQKTAALLTHISLIVAALAIIYPTYSSSNFYRYFIMIELVIYLALTIGCLRCIRTTSASSHFPDDTPLDELVQAELYKRRQLYSVLSSITVIATIVLVVGFLVSLGDPGVTASNNR